MLVLHQLEYRSREPSKGEEEKFESSSCDHWEKRRVNKGTPTTSEFGVILGPTSRIDPEVTRYLIDLIWRDV
jgi:hypothetical protein